VQEPEPEPVALPELVLEQVPERVQVLVLAVLPEE
jgi:hypothetical protein